MSGIRWLTTAVTAACGVGTAILPLGVASAAGTTQAPTAAIQVGVASPPPCLAPFRLPSVTAVAAGGGAATVSWDLGGSPCPPHPPSPVEYAIYAYSPTGPSSFTTTTNPSPDRLTGLASSSYYIFTVTAYRPGTGWTPWLPWSNWLWVT